MAEILNRHTLHTEKVRIKNSRSYLIINVDNIKEETRMDWSTRTRYYNEYFHISINKVTDGWLFPKNELVFSSKVDFDSRNLSNIVEHAQKVARQIAKEEENL